MNKDAPIEIGKLVFKAKGSQFGAYWSDNGAEKDALLLGSLNMGVVVKCAELKEEFIELMHKCILKAISETTGIDPEWIEEKVSHHDTPESA